MTERDLDRMTHEFISATILFTAIGIIAIALMWLAWPKEPDRRYNGGGRHARLR
jgi:hypothetical protein